MKTYRLLWLMSCFSMLMMVAPPQFIARAAASCGVPVDVTLDASECDCHNLDAPEDDSIWEIIENWSTLDGSCSGWEHSTIIYEGGFRDAYENESGYCSLTFTYETIGTKYPCIPQWDWSDRITCDGAGVACCIVCGCSVVGCLCIPGVVAACQYCTTHDCVGDTSDPEDIKAYIVTGYGEPCTG